MSYIRPYFINECYIGNEFTVTSGVTGSASTYALLEIFNPSNSGKLVIVNALFASTTSASSTGLGACFATSLFSGSAVTPIRKNSGGAPSSISSVTATPTASPITGYVGFALLNASLAPYNIVPDGDCFVITPGNGLVVTTTGVGATTLLGTFHWAEVLP